MGFSVFFPMPFAVLIGGIMRKRASFRQWFCKCDDPYQPEREVEARNPVQAAERFMFDTMPRYEDWDFSGSPENIIVEVRKSETAKKIVRVCIVPEIEMHFEGSVIKETID